MVEDIFGIQQAQEQQGFLNSTDNKQPQPQIVNHFQNQMNTEGWQLKSLTRQKSVADYDAVLSFLHPDGIFFALIKSLMIETSAKFDFSVSHFPPYFRSLIENGTAPPFFANKVISTSHKSASHIILNPFEFYIFHFSLYILNNSGSNYDPSNVLANEPAYFALLKIYLNYFVPVESLPRTTEGMAEGTNSNQHSSLWQSLSSKTTSILNLATNTSQSPAPPNGSNPPSLFKASIFLPQTPFGRSMTSNYLPASNYSPFYGQGEHLGSMEWRCSTFLLMLTELWFGNIPAPKTNYVLRSAPLDDLSISNLQPYSANIDQMAAARIVIKHLHSFSNSFTYSAMNHINNQGLAEVKQSIWTSKYPLQKRLYNFMKVAFNRWPLDYTFRQPLEAWLSYIQPWRYVRLNPGADSNSDLEDLDGSSRGITLMDVPSVDNHWKNFISDNLLYYTVIFFLLIDRLLKLDLSSSRNALMLFRVIKVYSQPGFLVLLREAEEAVIRNNLEHSFNKSPPKFSTPNRATVDSTNASKAKLLAPSFLASGRVSTPKTRFGAFERHLSNLENDSEFNYVSLFSPQAKQHMTSLLSEIQKSRILIKEFVQGVEVRSKMRSKGWIVSIKAFLTMDDACFESKDEREMYKDKIQAEEYLKFASGKISQYFDIQIPEVQPPERNTNNLTDSRRIFFNF